MNRVVVNYLLCFCAGSIFSLGAIAAINQASWLPVTLFGNRELAAVFRVVSPAIVAFTALVLLAFYWDSAARLASRVLGTGTPTQRSGPNAADRGLRSQREVTAVRDELERQLGRLIVLIASQLKNSTDHVASLKDTNAHLATVTDVTEIRDVVQSLIEKNETNERQTRDLEQRLKEAQDQASVLKQRLSQAEKLASLDPLTSVANRRRFEQFIADEVQRSHQLGTPLCLIMTDIDHFKKVNDRYGHSAGDSVLKAFAELLSRSVRGGDLVARYGGEEFAVVLPQTPMGDAFGIAERIRCTFERNGGVDEAVVNDLGRMTASFGVAEIREGEPPSELVRRADQMLYEAKHSGRNTTMIWSSATSPSEHV